MSTKTAGPADAFLAGSPARQVMATVGDKWASLVVIALAAGPLRHGQVAATVAGASQKMLTQALRTLERDGLLSRTIIASVPVRVDYELTELGRSLLPVLTAVKDWSQSHADQIAAAQDDYDSRNP